MYRKKPISDLSKWSASHSGTTISLNDWPGINALQGMEAITAVFQYPPNEYIEFRSPGMNPENLSELRFYARRYYGQSVAKFRKHSDFEFKLQIGNTTEAGFVILETFYIPLYRRKNMEFVTLDVKDLGDFDTIRIIKMSDQPQRLNIAGFIVCTDETTFDIHDGLKEVLDRKIKFARGTLPAAVEAGAKKVALTDTSYMTRHTLLEFSEGELVEYHQIDGEVDPLTGEVAFTKEYDGLELQNSFSEACQVAIIVPAITSQKSAAYVEPAIYINGVLPNFASESKDFGLDLKYYFDSYKSDKVRLVFGDKEIQYPINLIVVTEKPELMDAINTEIFKLFGDYFVLQNNGLHYDVLYKNQQFDEGNLEGESDRTLHSIEIRSALPMGRQAKYMKFPLDLKVDTEVRSVIYGGIKK